MQNLFDNFSKMQMGESIILAAGWLAEDLDCLDRRTIAQKTHRLSNNKGRIVTNNKGVIFKSSMILELCDLR